MITIFAVQCDSVCYAYINYIYMGHYMECQCHQKANLFVKKENFLQNLCSREQYSLYTNLERPIRKPNIWCVSFICIMEFVWSMNTYFCKQYIISSSLKREVSLNNIIIEISSRAFENCSIFFGKSNLVLSKYIHFNIMSFHFAAK